MRTIVALGISAVVVSAFVVGTARAGDAAGIKSGLQVGDHASPFQVEDITGPNKGTSLCYRWQYGQSPVVCIFARATSAPLTSLVKQVDAAIEKNPDLKSFVVVLTDDADTTASKLKSMAADCRLKNVPLTLVESPAGPPEYKIDKGAEVTVMLWRETEVKANHVYTKGGLTEADVKTIIAELPKILKD